MMMKKQNVGNACGWADRLARLLLLPALTLVLLCSCDEDKAKSERPEEGDQLWKIVPVLASESDGFEGLGEYGVSLYLFNDMSSDCYKYQHADSFGDLEPFVSVVVLVLASVRPAAVVLKVLVPVRVPTSVLVLRAAPSL